MHRIVATPEEEERFAAEHVANLWAAAARYPDDPGVARLVSDLRASSPEFERRWQQRRPAENRGLRKRIRHPEVGVLELDCDVLHVPDVDQMLIVYSAAPGTRDADGLALLRVLGTQGGAETVRAVPGLG